MQNNHMHQCPLFSLLLFFLILLESYLTSYSLHGAENEREFDYVEGSDKGPRHWGEIRKDWAACKNGGMQSPIDLLSQRVKLIPRSGQLKRNYKSCNATVKNRGHDISVRKQSSQTLWILFIISFSYYLHSYMTYIRDRTRVPFVRPLFYNLNRSSFCSIFLLPLLTNKPKK